MTSSFLKLNWSDFGKGLLLAVFVAILGFVQQLLKEKGLDITGEDLKSILTMAIDTAIAYLVKNLFTNSEGQFGRAEKKVA